MKKIQDNTEWLQLKCAMDQIVNLTIMEVILEKSRSQGPKLYGGGNQGSKLGKHYRILTSKTF